jgi:intracellular multiplication protein IcmB
MPIMPDLARIAADPRVANLYGEAMHNGERIIDIFSRHINAGIESYRLLCGYTRLNLGAARAVSIDLQEVVGTTSEEGRRRSGLMFLLARFVGARNYFLTWESMESLCPARFAAYQRQRVGKLWETVKFLQYDEAHYCSGVESVARLMSSDLRTGRKFNLIAALFSQMLNDFSPEVLENVYNVFIMGLGEFQPETVRKTFSLSVDEMKAIAEHCNRPGVMFARFKTQVGVLSQVVQLHASAYEQWAFTTRGRNPALRAALAGLIGYAQALDLLADRFPRGSAEAYIERHQAVEDGARADDDALVMRVARALLAS